MGFWDFFADNNSQRNYNLLVSFYEKYVTSCTLQPTIFSQMAFPNGEMDVINSSYVENKNNYIAEFSRLIDVIRIGNIVDRFGNCKNITMGQEFFLRFTLATWIMSKLNSYDDLGKKIRMAMNLGYQQLFYIVDLEILFSGKWRARGSVHLYRSNFDAINFDFKDTIMIDESIFNSGDPLQVYTTFNDTPKELLTTMYQLTRLLLFGTPPLIELNHSSSRGEIYAEFWLKKMLASIILCSEEWDEYIHDDDNIEEIRNVRYYLWDENPYIKQIQFKFDLKLQNMRQPISFDYEYSISSAEVFDLRHIDKICDIVLTNHNLDY